MAGVLKIYSLYKLQTEEKYFLLRTEQFDYSNSNQNQQDLAESIEQKKRILILDLIGKRYNENVATKFDLIGELQSPPIGEELYTSHGDNELTVFYLDTEYGFPWIIIGSAKQETDFMNELNDDEELLNLKPIGKPTRIVATFVTENDFDHNI